MMDFFVREIRAVVPGPMAIIRYGTCGGLGPDAIPGTVVCASQGSSFVGRNYDYFRPGGAESGQKPYTMYDVRTCRLLICCSASYAHEYFACRLFPPTLLSAPHLCPI